MLNGQGLTKTWNFRFKVIFEKAVPFISNAGGLAKRASFDQGNRNYNIGLFMMNQCKLGSITYEL